MKQRTILAFDFGTRYIGVAVGQEVTCTARPLQSLAAKDGVPNWQQLQQLIDTWQPDLLVVGLPLNMDGSEQPLTQRTRKFAQRLQGRFALAVELQDERLSTISAKEHLFSQGGYRALQKSQVDAYSAVVILESWFNDRAAN